MAGNGQLTAQLGNNGLANNWRAPNLTATYRDALLGWRIGSVGEYRHNATDSAMVLRAAKPPSLSRKLMAEGRLLGTFLREETKVKHSRGTGPGRHALQQSFRGDPFPLKRGCLVTFDVKFDPGFEWGCRGKIGGLRVGPGDAGGGEYSRDGASLRVMWDKGGGAYAYVYVPQGTHRMQPDPLAEKKRTGAGLFKEGFEGAFRGEGWHTVTLGLKLNAVRGGKPAADGVLLFGVDGSERRLDNVVWRVDDALDVERFVLGVFHGGPCKATRTSFSNYRNIRVYDW